MKVVRVILIGSVLSVIYQLSNVAMANDRFAQSHADYQIAALEISFALIKDAVEADNFASAYDADFLLAHQTEDGYVMGVKYLDFNVADELREGIDNSQLWIGLQFSF